MMIRRNALVLICAAIPAGCATMEDGHRGSAATMRAATPTSGEELLRWSSEAIAKADVLSYDANYTSTGWVRPFIADIEGTVVVGKRSQWDVDPFRCQVKLAKGDDTAELTAGSNGDIYFLVDPGTRTAHVDMDPLVLGKHSRDVQRVVLTTFAEPKPFEEELGSESIELIGTSVVEGTECYDVKVTQDFPSESVFSIAKGDLIPRRIARVFPNRQDAEGEPGTTELVLTNVRINPRYPKDPFVAQVPAGYATTDEFPE